MDGYVHRIESIYGLIENQSLSNEERQEKVSEILVEVFEFGRTCGCNAVKSKIASFVKDVTAL